MISLSENQHDVEGVDMRKVVALEFEDVRGPSIEDTRETSVETTPVADGRERAIVTELEGRFRSQTEAHLAEIEEVRRKTRDEVRQELAAEVEEKIAEERVEVARVCERFTKERGRYFAEVEAEVVRLSLLIAARVLHRETEIDPLILKGAVRVALEKLQGIEAASLHVPEGQVEAWTKILVDAHRDDVSVVGDSRLQAGECFLETSVGRIELGVKAQLEEIEKGFFDLLQQRPA
jgi:flagellar assembly protein FliH